MSTPSAPVCVVLSATCRRTHPHGQGLSLAQRVRHSRGAQSLRSSLLDATIAIGFMPLFGNPAAAMHVSGQLVPASIQTVENSKSGETFVFARQARSPIQDSVDPSADIFAAFLPLSMPAHLSPCLSTTTSCTPISSVSSTASQLTSTSRRGAPSNSWVEAFPQRVPTCYFDPLLYTSLVPSPTHSKTSKNKRRTRSPDSEGIDGEQEQKEQSLEQFVVAADLNLSRV